MKNCKCGRAGLLRWRFQLSNRGGRSALMQMARKGFPNVTYRDAKLFALKAANWLRPYMNQSSEFYANGYITKEK